MESIRLNNIKLISSQLATAINKDLSSQRDKAGRTLLHLACINNNSYVAHEIIRLQKQYYQEVLGANEFLQNENIRKFINIQDDQGNAAIHLASYVGNTMIIGELKSLGCDYQLLNINGQGLMHLAAQGKQVACLCYLRESFDQDPGLADDQYTTPLHQACYNNAFNVVCFLLAWGVDVNAQDSFGESPLHICAMKGCDDIVKKLLYKNVKKRILNKKGQSPAYVAMEYHQNNVLNLLTSSKSNFKKNCIRMSIKSRKRSRMYQILYLFQMTLSLLITIIFTLQFIKYEWQICCFFIASIFTILAFITVNLSDPGYLINPNKKQSIYELVLTNDIEDVCPECQLQKPFRSKHCDFCQRCVMVYDHHCPWINNCIGAKNHIYFISFITSLMIYSIVTICLNAQYIGETQIGEERFQIWIPTPNLQILQIILQVFNLFLSIGIMFPLVYLIYVQINNLLLDQTTFERFIIGRVQRGNSFVIKRRHSIKEESSQKTIRNCALICCENKSIKRYLVEDEKIGFEIKR